LRLPGAPFGPVDYKGLMDEVSVYNRALTTNEVRAIYAAGAAGKCVPTPPPVCVPSPSGLVSWWRAEGNGNDSAGANNGVLQGGMTFGAGEVGQAFSFDGTSNAITIPASASLDVGQSGGLTVEAWINPADTVTRPIVDWSPNGTYGAHFWARNVGGLYADLYGTDNSSHIIQSVGGLLVTNAFQHVAVTYDKASGIAQLWLNGAVVQQASLGSFTPQTSYPLNIGLRLPGAPFGPVDYKGLMDEVSVYNRALTTNELQAIYNAGVSGKCKAPPAIIVQPASQKVTTGLNATFTVTAVGTPTLHYQWSYNGTNITGAIGSSLTLTNVQIGSGGNYSVTVTNAFGSVTSSNAILTVNRVPVARITASPLINLLDATNVIICANNTNVTVVLDGSLSTDADNDPLTYSWTEGTNALGTGITATNAFGLGSHTVNLVVSDGASAGINSVTFEVITPSEAVGILAAFIDGSPLAPRIQRPLQVRLRVASALFELGRFRAGALLLRVFQYNVRMRIEPVDPVLGHKLIDAAQQIINALACVTPPGTGGQNGNIYPLARQADGKMLMQFTGVPGEVYVIEASTNLVDWEVIDVPVDMGNGAFEFEDQDSANFPARFYRVVAP
jgi:Concanavalin A-like lectin/glucanases superfamily/Immunoglobulin domain